MATAVQFKPYLLRRVSTDIKYAEIVMGTGITESVYWPYHTPSRWAQDDLIPAMKISINMFKRWSCFVFRRFGGKYWLHLRGDNLVQAVAEVTGKEKIFRLCRKFSEPFSSQSYVKRGEGIGLHPAFHFSILPNKTHSPWRWRQYFLPNRRNEFKVVYAVKTQSWT